MKNLIISILLMLVASVTVQAQEVLDGNKNMSLFAGADVLFSREIAPRAVLGLDYRIGANLIVGSAAIGQSDHEFSLGYRRELGKYYRAKAVPFIGAYASMRQGEWSIEEDVISDVLEDGKFRDKTHSFYPTIGFEAGVRINTKKNQNIWISGFANYGIPKDKMSELSIDIDGAQIAPVAYEKPQSISFGIRLTYRFVLIGKTR